MSEPAGAGGAAGAPNPVLVEITRGRLVESRHRGALAVADATGRLVLALGDVARPVFPRSAIKPLQALPFLETGAADAFGFGDAALALACASHSGAPRHVRLVADMLARVGLDATRLACGRHLPFDEAEAQALIRAGKAPSALHHNCSGKHAAMLATAVHCGEPVEGYWRPDHPVQERVRAALEAMLAVPLGEERCGVDGCSVPNWAAPLRGLAHAFARFARPDGLAPRRRAACRRLAAACLAEPELVAGRRRADTVMIEALAGRVLVKAGAEGVHMAALLQDGLGVALKIDDGAKRAAEAAIAFTLGALLAPDDPPAALARLARRRLANWQGRITGELRPAAPLWDAALALRDIRV